MAKDVVGEAAIEIVADDSRFRQDLAKSKDTVTGFVGEIKKIFSGMGDGGGLSQSVVGVESLVAGLKSVFAVSIAGYGAKQVWGWATDLAMQAAKATDDLADLSSMIGVSLGQVAQLKYAVGSLGENWGEVSGTLGLFARNIAMAAEGEERSASAFARLGVNVKDANGEIRTTEQVLLDVADRFADMEDGPKKIQIAMEVAGRGGRALIPILSEGGDKIREMIALAESRGYVLSPEAGKAAAEYLGSVNDLDAAIGSLWKKVGEGLQPALKEINKEFATWIEENKDWIAKDLAGVLKTCVELFSVLGKTIVTAVEIARPALELLSQSIGTALEGYQNIWTQIKSLANYLTDSTETEIVTARRRGITQETDEYVGGLYSQATDGVRRLDIKSGGLPPERKFEYPKFELQKHEEAVKSIGGAVKSIADEWEKSNKALELQIKLANQDYEIMQLMAKTAAAMMPAMVGGTAMPAGFEGLPSRQMPNLMEMFPEAAGIKIPGFDQESFERFWGQYNQIAGMGDGTIATAFDQIRQEIDAMTPQIEASLDNLAQVMSTKAQLVAQIGQAFADAFVSMFSVGMQNGFKAGVKAFLGALIQGIGQILAQEGSFLFMHGLMEVIFGSAPPPFTRPDLIAHGGKAMAFGLAMMAGGGALMGIGSALGNTGGTGSSAGSTMASTGTATPTAPSSITYSVGGSGQANAAAGGGGNTVINISAIDTQSFDDALRRGGRSAIMDITAEDYRLNGQSRSMRGWS